jgi:protein-disulfide isomerase
MKERVANVLTLATVLGAVAVLVLLAMREVEVREANRLARDGIDVSHVPNLAREATSADHLRQTARIVVFADYTCPSCREFDGVLEGLRASSGGAVLVEHRHFPLVMDGPSLAAAVAVECARTAGRFAEYQGIVYQHQPTLAQIHRDVQWDSLATLAGVGDVEAFRECIDQQQSLDVIRTDRELGERIGVFSTPTMVINGRLFRGSVSSEALGDRIARLSGEAEPSG